MGQWCGWLAGAVLANQQGFEDDQGGRFVQWFVVVATVGTLDARRAACLTGAFFNRTQRGFPQLRQQLEALLRDSDTSRESVVEEDLRPPGLGVVWGGKAANVLPVTHGKQR